MRQLPENESQAVRKRSVWREITAFSIGVGIPLILALNGGGYDVVIRQQAGAVVWAGAALALIAGLLPAVRVSAAARGFLLPAAAFLAWCILSLLWTSDVEATGAEIARVIGYAGPIVLLCLVLGRDNWRLAAAGLTVALLAVPVLSLTSRFGPDLFPADSFARTYGGERLGYPLEYWNALGCWAAMAVAAGFAWSATLRSGAAHLAIAFIPPAATCLYLTHSRGAAVAAVAGVILVCVLAKRREQAVQQLAVAAAGCALAVVIVSRQEVGDAAFGSGGLTAALGTLGGAALAAGGSLLLRRGVRNALVSPRFLAATAGLLAAGLAVFGLMNGTHEGVAPESNAPAPPSIGVLDSAESLSSLEGPRREIFGSALSAYASEPVLGIGPGTFETWWVEDSPGAAPLRDAHSLYLETLAELGVPGLILLLAGIAGLLRFATLPRRGLRRSRDHAASAAMLSCGVVFLVHASVDWLWEVPAVSVTGLAALAIAGGRASARRPGRRRINMGRLAVAALALAAVVTQIPGLVKTERLRASEAILALGFEDRARELALEAADAEPWAASPHAQLGLIALADRQLDEAEAETERAAELAPADWTHRFTLVRIRVEQGDTAGALSALDAAEQRNPGIAENASQIREELDRGTAPAPLDG